MLRMHWMLMCVLLCSLTACRTEEKVSIPMPPVEISTPSEGATFESSIGMKFKLIPAGKFLMGSPEDEKDRDGDETQHEVTLTKAFYMGIYPVTQDEYQKVMGNNPSYFKGGNRPVETVSWDDAQDFCKKLTALDIQAGKLKPGESYRLPTEAEWEYACRAGTKTRFYWGDDLDYTQIGDYVWYYKNSDNQTHDVGQKKLNAFGLYDMSGNVYQWCGDWYGDYPAGAVTDPTGPGNGQSRVERCGFWHGHPLCGRSSHRNGVNPDYPVNIIGFRIVLTSSEK